MIPDWFVFLLKANLSLALWYAFYRLLLARETFFVRNRWFLLLGMGVSLWLPSLSLPFLPATPDTTVIATQPITWAVSEDLVIPAPSEVIEDHNYWMDALWLIYGMGVLTSFLLVIKDLFALLRLYQSQPKVQMWGRKVILTDGKTPTLSFFGWLFWDNTRSLTPTQAQQVYAHELTHIRQWHSVDVLLVQGLCVLCWWSPVVYLYRQAIKTNHEFLADAAAKGKQARSYALLLLEQTLFVPNPTLTNNFFQIPLKKRIQMMRTSPSSPRRHWKFALALPLLCVLALFVGRTESYPGSPDQATALPLLLMPPIQEVLPIDSPIVETKTENYKQRVVVIQSDGKDYQVVSSDSATVLLINGEEVSLNHPRDSGRVRVLLRMIDGLEGASAGEQYQRVRAFFNSDSVRFQSFDARGISPVQIFRRRVAMDSLRTWRSGPNRTTVPPAFIERLEKITELDTDSARLRGIEDLRRELLEQRKAQLQKELEQLEQRLEKVK